MRPPQSRPEEATYDELLARVRYLTEQDGGAAPEAVEEVEEMIVDDIPF